MNEQMKQILAKMTADKKKFSLMVGLIAVAMLMWGRLLLKEVPQSASATPGQQAAAQVVSGNTPVSTIGSYARNVIFVDIPQSMNRDLFYVKRSIYVDEPKAEVDNPQAGKSGTLPSDVQEQIKAASIAFSSLKLETTIMGKAPKALINGRLLGVGQSINGFKVNEILSHRVVLERQGRTYRLDMH